MATFHIPSHDLHGGAASHGCYIYRLGRRRGGKCPDNDAGVPVTAVAATCVRHCGERGRRCVRAGRGARARGSRI
eukprot:scaffold18998_cov125-Isochrysis_galbana.AAC.7